MQSFVTTILY